MSPKKEASRLSIVHLMQIASLPFTAALGEYLFSVDIGFAQLYAFRFVVIGIFGMIFWRLMHGDSNYDKISDSSRDFLYIGAVWILWGLASITWSPNAGDGLKEVLSIILGFLVSFNLIKINIKKSSALIALRWGWFWAFITTAIIGVWELLTQNHLQSRFASVVENMDSMGLCLSTFGNPNNFGAFLLLASPFLIWAFVDAKKRIHRFLILFFLILLILLIVFTASRLAIFGEIITLIVFVILRVDNRKSILWVFVLIGFVVGVIAILSTTDAFVVTKFVGLSDELGASGSGSERLNLVMSGLWLGFHSWGMGVGAGSFPYYMAHRLTPFDAGGTLSPHNFWTEIFSQYGGPVLLLMLTWVLRFGLYAYRARRVAIRAKNHSLKLLSDVAIVSFLGYWFATACNSSFIGQPCNWVILASWVVISGEFESSIKNEKFLDKI